MSKNVVVVESPAKVRTIKKYLGRDFNVLACYGHVRDLIPKTGAVEPDNDFLMHYDPIKRNQKHVKAISDAMKEADALYLATDPDREGEAISWHVTELLHKAKALGRKPVYRVVFHEITEQAIQHAIAHPRAISTDLVNAQQARRALDYLVGFNLSPLLWKKIRPGLSAGRVQSPALRMIVERELEIEAFQSREYWTVEADLRRQKQDFVAKLTRLRGRKLSQFSINNKIAATDAKDRIAAAADGMLYIHQVTKKQRKRNPEAPFITSTLQQEAARKLNFSAQRTMRIAQQLYEGVNIGSGAVGLITYMRTDSVTLAQEALTDIRAYIQHHYGNHALPPKARTFKTRARNAQEAHEAIRPTAVQNAPEAIGSHLSGEQHDLYELIWKRTVASQMIHATIDTVAIDLGCGITPISDPEDLFRATGSTIATPGFLTVYEESAEDTAKPAAGADSNPRLPQLEAGDTVDIRALRPEQHFTEPPPRYSEASLIRALEDHGIGRPSTYAQILQTLQQREYAELSRRRFQPTDVGRLVNNFLTNHFSDYVDYEFTARLENDLDLVAKGDKQWLPLLRNFWEPFHLQVQDKTSSVSRSEAAQTRTLGTDPKTGKIITARIGRFGPYVQLGDAKDDEKPICASLTKEHSINSITLEEALVLFGLPRKLGETAANEPVIIGIGRFGPYAKYGAKYVSLESTDNPYTISLSRALSLIEAKRLIDVQREIRNFGDTGIRILNGRYGPYITDGKKNARIPKDQEPAAIELAEAEQLLQAAPSPKSKSKRSPSGGRPRTTKQR